MASESSLHPLLLLLILTFPLDGYEIHQHYTELAEFSIIMMCIDRFSVYRLDFSVLIGHQATFIRCLQCNSKTLNCRALSV